MYEIHTWYVRKQKQINNIIDSCRIIVNVLSRKIVYVQQIINLFNTRATVNEIVFFALIIFYRFMITNSARYFKDLPMANSANAV